MKYKTTHIIQLIEKINLKMEYNKLQQLVNSNLYLKKIKLVML